jgi:SWI/SNF-related matrix-associated actin-dependent regulator of chromatin subfamily A member 5
VFLTCFDCTATLAYLLQQADLQAMDRAHRIGQKKEVTVYRLISDNTVEEAVVKKAQKKMMLDQLVIQQGKLVEKTQALSKEEILGMVKKGAQELLLSGEKKSDDELDIDHILATSIDRTAKEDSELRAQFGQDSNRMNFTFDGSMYQFEVSTSHTIVLFFFIK